LSGLILEVEKVDRLADYNYLLKNILRPALVFSIERKHITAIESKILNIAIEKKMDLKTQILKIYFRHESRPIFHD